VERFSFDVNRLTTAQEVKQMVEMKTGIAPARQRLHSPVAGHRMLDDYSTLEEEGITAGCNLSVCFKLDGGGDTENRGRSPTGTSKSSHGFHVNQASRRQDDDQIDGEEADDLQGLIRSAVKDKSMQTTYIQILKDEGFDSAKSLEDYEVDGLVKDFGIRPGHARSIVREVPNWIPQLVSVCNHCEDRRQKLLILPVKMSSSLQLLRRKIFEHYQEDFVFVCADTEIQRSQENEAINSFFKNKRGTDIPTIDIQFLNGFVPVSMRQRHSTGGSVSSQRSRDFSPSLVDSPEQDRSGICNSSKTDRDVAAVSINGPSSFREVSNATNVRGVLGSTEDTASNDRLMNENAHQLDGLLSVEKAGSQLGNVLPPVEPSVTAIVSESSDPLEPVPSVEQVIDPIDPVPSTELVEPSTSTVAAEGSDPIHSSPLTEQVEPLSSTVAAEVSFPDQPMAENDGETEGLGAVVSLCSIQGQEDEALEEKGTTEFGADSELNVGVYGLSLTREDPGDSSRVSSERQDLNPARSTLVVSSVFKGSLTFVTAASPTQEIDGSTTTDHDSQLQATAQAITVSSGSTVIASKKKRQRNRSRNRKSSATVNFTTRTKHEECPPDSFPETSEVSNPTTTSASLPESSRVATRDDKESDVGSLHSDSTDMRAAYKDGPRQDSSGLDALLLQIVDTSSDVPVMPADVPVSRSVAEQISLPRPASCPVSSSTRAEENNNQPVTVLSRDRVSN
jgi:hypothetical protein